MELVNTLYYSNSELIITMLLERFNCIQRCGYEEEHCRLMQAVSMAPMRPKSLTAVPGNGEHSDLEVCCNEHYGGITALKFMCGGREGNATQF
jgi:hypothetical protein